MKISLLVVLMTVLVAGCGTVDVVESAGVGGSQVMSASSGPRLHSAESLRTFDGVCDGGDARPSGEGGALLARVVPTSTWARLARLEYGLGVGEGCGPAPHHLAVYADDPTLDVPRDGAMPLFSMDIEPTSAGAQRVDLPEVAWPAGQAAWIALAGARCVEECAAKLGRSYRSDEPWSDPPPASWRWRPLGADLRFRLTAFAPDDR